jgi:hypothetical protein
MPIESIMQLDFVELLAFLLIIQPMDWTTRTLDKRRFARKQRLTMEQKSDQMKGNGFSL